MRWWRGRSLRARLVILGTCGLGVGFLVGGVVLFGVLGLALQRSIDTAAESTAREVAALAAEGRLSDPLPVSGGQLVQVVDAQGRVRSASIGADRLVPLLQPKELAEARKGNYRYVHGSRATVEGPIRVVALPAGDDTVVVGRPVGEMYRSMGVLRGHLLVVYPVLVIAIGVVGWRVVGAALRPVEQLRAGAESITGSRRDDRLPVPCSEDEIQRLAITLNGMLDRLSAARARQRAFVADAAHELRSPLTAMRTELEVAGRHGIPPDLVPDLLADVVRLSRLVDDLLLLARADDAGSGAAPAKDRFAPVDVADVLREARDRSRGARVPVTLVLDDGPDLTTLGEHDALLRAVANLLDNAVRHAAGRVTLTGYPEAGHAVIEVTDDGPGIPEVDRERVFDRFTRLDDARARDEGGSGLGLAIVRELVRRHDGSVTLADAGPGLRATIRLPLTRALIPAP
ncbi:two-component sensor histidine kinase [Virgisporangium ochraceum]|uniref:histidine kinase n=2 Tax=Virgisporangium ochraceum TaxID=65505 RepID=A0A8J4A3R1_9ACTN|nr:ATP-binding protein [Virgisporangium ochraceum]GIJ74283.1 two-component sensor histidine kinase [Virgisporangium ochraceum]